MTTLYLHIGSEKTGTTTIQHYSAHHADTIKERGALFGSAETVWSKWSQIHCFFQNDRTDYFSDTGMLDREEPWSIFETFMMTW